MARDPVELFEIAPVIEHYGGTPTYRGGWSPMCCFLHGEQNPSAAVNHVAQKFICHVGCLDRAEDAIGLVQHIERCDFRQAVEKCREISTSTGAVSPRKQGLADMFD